MDPLQSAVHPMYKIMPNETPEALARKVFIRCCTTIASTVLLFLDFAHLFRDEYRFIWRAPINLIKCIYISSRYLILLFQTCVQFMGNKLLIRPICHSANSVIVTTHMYKIPISGTVCFCWTSAQTGVMVSSLTLLEVILMLRVYALHGKSHNIGVTFICSLTFGVSCNVVSLVTTLREMNVDDACVARHTPGGVFVFGASCISQQLLIWGLTFRGWWSFLQTMNDAGQRISQVMVRDGTWVLIGVCATMSITIPYSVYIDQVTHVLFSIVIPLFSISTCRLIINMQCLNGQVSSTNSQELTSIEVTGTVSQISQTSLV
ncbi:hypothetical protein AMATHDRAFT_66000 [Amanita thiersii Skay4041]|uniref:DUF6533 domain-containing protein n=1 Tax=Amanita thiersii Skay4041 TaxID=703135 RepID=A0A2A9NDW6_9AGAR|nr:hypothetical protein AMATHDRAFT_66000 [Amanita thiersii Skay4041]